MAAGAGQVVVPRAPAIFPLSIDQQRTFEVYTSDNFFQRLKRDYFFISSNAFYQADLRCRTLTGLGVGGAIGFLATYLTMRCLRTEDAERDNKMTVRITGFGTCLGATVGALFGANHTITQMEQSQEFLTWRDQAIRNNVYPLFQRFLQDQDQLLDLLCPLTQELIRQPVRAPNGKIYEKAAIEAWLSRKAIDYPPERLAAMTPQLRNEALLTFCPCRSCHLTSDMLVYDFDYHRNVAVAMKPLFDQEINAQFRQGLLNFRIAMIKDRETLLNEIIREITARYAAGTIPEHEFLEAIRKCRAHYSIPE